MKTYKFIALAGLLVVLSAFVYALTLVSEVEVDTCHDFDGGVVLNLSSAVFTTVNGSFDPYYDSCLDDDTIVEYACSVVGNTTFLQTWEETCDCIDGACVEGPDLIVSNLTIEVMGAPSNVTNGSATIIVEVSNIGSESARNSTTLIHIVTGGAEFVFTPDLDPSESVTFNETFSLVPGDYNVTVIADTTDLVSETRENNNVATAGFVVP